MTHAVSTNGAAPAQFRRINPHLGLMVDAASPRGRAVGHTGQGPSSVAAAYRFGDLDPPCTAAAFAPVEDQGAIERAVLALPEAMS